MKIIAVINDSTGEVHAVLKGYEEIRMRGVNM